MTAECYKTDVLKFVNCWGKNAMYALKKDENANYEHVVNWAQRGLPSLLTFFLSIGGLKCKK